MIRRTVCRIFAPFRICVMVTSWGSWDGHSHRARHPQSQCKARPRTGRCLTTNSVYRAPIRVQLALRSSHSKRVSTARSSTTPYKSSRSSTCPGRRAPRSRASIMEQGSIPHLMVARDWDWGTTTREGRCMGGPAPKPATLKVASSHPLCILGWSTGAGMEGRRIIISIPLNRNKPDFDLKVRGYFLLKSIAIVSNQIK